ncbi:MAG: hypothetical protein FWH40_01275 [Coriobacteriia bacterium]|nr:hypothetical protein [Coriobacteriia bacterium]
MGKLVYNPELMEEISKSYEACAAYTQDLIDNMTETDALLVKEFRGHASEIAKEAFSKTIEHLELLKKCFEQSGIYVDFTLATMIEADRKTVAGGR